MEINGVPVISGTLTAPRFGALTGYAELNVSVPVGGAVLNESSTVTILTSSVYANRCHVTFEGGLGGGLSNDIDSKNFVSPTVGQILASILQGTGELQSPLTDPSVLLKSFSFYSILSGTVKEALTMLAVTAGVDWRTLYDGTIWLGTGDPIPSVGEEPTLLNQRPDRGYAVFANESLDIRPGMELSVGTAQRVRYDAGEVERCTVWYG